MTADNSFRYPVGNENGNGWLKNRTGLQWLEEYDYEGTCGLDFNKDDTSCDDDEGEPVYAVANGEVIESYYESGSTWGNLIIVKHVLPNQEVVFSLYGHLKDRYIYEGNNVKKGALIGTVGKGIGLCAHLHFEIRKSNMNGFPTKYFPCGESNSFVEEHYCNPENFIKSDRFLTLPLKFNSTVVNGWLHYSKPNSIGLNHYGIDYEASYDQEVVAAADGVAMTSSQYAYDSNGVGIGYGKFVLIRHNDTNDGGLNYFSLYAHVNRAATSIKSYPEKSRANTTYSEWTPVSRGETIAYVGKENTSWVHLHFEVQIGGYALNKTDPYDLGDKATTTEVDSADYYPPSGYLYTSCGPNYLWTSDPPLLCTFWDVQEASAWYYSYVHCLNDLGIVSGYPDGSYKPEDTVNRVEFIKMTVNALELALGYSLDSQSSADALPEAWDVDPHVWFYPFLVKAYLYENINNSPPERMAFWNANESPDWSAGVTREGASHIVMNALKLKPYIEFASGNLLFTDVPELYHQPYYHWIYAVKIAGIIDGYDDKTFGPENVLNRAEAAKMIWNLLDQLAYFELHPEYCELHPTYCNL